MDDHDGFYKKNKDSLFAYLYRMTGDYYLAWDVVQESFVRYLNRYRGNSDSRSLLYTIARNAAMDAFRKPKMIPYNSDVHDKLVENPEQQLVDQQAYKTLLEAIRQLSALDRELIALVAGADLSYRQIGKIMHISEANVKVKVHRARLRLKEKLGSGGK